VTAHDVAAALPSIEVVRDRCRAMAMLDAMIEPNWDDRFHAFDKLWSENEELATMRDGGGGEFSIVFSSRGAFVRGFDPDVPMSPYLVRPPRLWPGLVESVPASFAEYLSEPAFSGHHDFFEATVCIWRTTGDPSWYSAPVEYPRGVDDPDGADDLFKLVVSGRPSLYRSFAVGLLDFDVDIDIVTHIYALEPLTRELVSRFNPQRRMKTLMEDVEEIGYPFEF
jgi:hypothetical protein